MTNEPETQWAAHLELMDQAVTTKDADGAVRAWRDAYAAALGGAGWQGLVEVAAACLRIGEIPGFRKACEAKARQTYWTALFRARQQRSCEGVLRVAEAFGGLGARAMVDECIRIAEHLAAREEDEGVVDRVRAAAGALTWRFLTAGVAVDVAALSLPR